MNYKQLTGILKVFYWEHCWKLQKRSVTLTFYLHMASLWGVKCTSPLQIFFYYSVMLIPVKIIKSKVSFFCTSFVSLKCSILRTLVVFSFGCFHDHNLVVDFTVDFQFGIKASKWVKEWNQPHIYISEIGTILSTFRVKKEWRKNEMSTIYTCIITICFSTLTDRIPVKIIIEPLSICQTEALT